MNWQSGPLRWPASAVGLHAQARTVLSDLPTALAAATDRLQALAGQAPYRRHPLSDQAAALLGLRAALDAWLANGQCLTVTPDLHGVGLRQGGQSHLSAPNAVARLAAKLQDGADPRCPSGPLYAQAWLVTATTPDALARALAPLCTVLPLPAWCATLRRLQADNDLMTQPTAALVPRWKSTEPLLWAPLRPAHSLLGSELAQLESLARDADTPITRLSALAQARTARLDALAQAVAALATLAGQLWHWQGQGTPASLAAQLSQSAPPDHTHTQSVAALLLSPAPLTFWQEMTP